MERGRIFAEHGLASRVRLSVPEKLPQAGHVCHGPTCHATRSGDVPSNPIARTTHPPVVRYEWNQDARARKGRHGKHLLLSAAGPCPSRPVGWVSTFSIMRLLLTCASKICPRGTLPARMSVQAASRQATPVNARPVQHHGDRPACGTALFHAE